MPTLRRREPRPRMLEVVENFEIVNGRSVPREVRDERAGMRVPAAGRVRRGERRGEDKRGRAETESETDRDEVRDEVDRVRDEVEDLREQVESLQEQVRQLRIQARPPHPRPPSRESTL
jgi:hypothetical protein